MRNRRTHGNLGAPVRLYACAQRTEWLLGDYLRSSMEHYDIVIARSGPADTNTALSWQRVAPELTAEMVVLEKARHQRPNLCGGGATILADPVMRWLDLSQERLAVPHLPIHEIRLCFGDRETKLRLRNMFRIVRRSQFDARLVAIARNRGIEVRKETPVTGLQRSAEGVVVQTPIGDIRARVAVGAGGASGLCRGRLQLRQLRSAVGYQRHWSRPNAARPSASVRLQPKPALHPPCMAAAGHLQWLPGVAASWIE